LTVPLCYTAALGGNAAKLVVYSVSYCRSKVILTSDLRAGTKSGVCVSRFK